MVFDTIEGAHEGIFFQFGVGPGEDLHFLFGIVGFLGGGLEACPLFFEGGPPFASNYFAESGCFGGGKASLADFFGEDAAFFLFCQEEEDLLIF